MDNVPLLFRFFQVDSNDAEEAFSFHKLFADTGHILLRSEAQIKAYADDGELFGIREARSGKFVGLVYSILEGETWEVGGLVVNNDYRRLRLGSFLVNFALAYTLGYSSPWDNGQTIIAHVHDENEKPRNVLTRAGFKFVRKIEAPVEVAASLKRNADGKVIGLEYLFPEKSAAGLSRWFHEFNGLLGDGISRADFDFGLSTLDQIRTVLDDITSRFNG